MCQYWWHVFGRRSNVLFLCALAHVPLVMWAVFFGMSGVRFPFFRINTASLRLFFLFLPVCHYLGLSTRLCGFSFTFVRTNPCVLWMDFVFCPALLFFCQYFLLFRRRT